MQMNITYLERTAKELVVEGKGILAADETPETLTKRIAQLKIDSTPDSRRVYREMLFATPDVAEFISGLIRQDDATRHQIPTGISLAEGLMLKRFNRCIQ